MVDLRVNVWAGKLVVVIGARFLYEHCMQTVAL